MGVVASGSSLVSDEMFLSAAGALAAETSATDLEQGRLYPPLTRIREVSLAISTAVAGVAFERNLATMPRPDDLRSYIRALNVINRATLITPELEGKGSGAQTVTHGG